MADLSTDLATSIAADVATDLAAASYTPNLFSYDPITEASYHFQVTAGGAFTDRVGGSLSFTLYNSPTFNATGSWGVPSLSFVAGSAQYGEITDSAFLDLLDDTGEFTAIFIGKFDSVASGVKNVWSTGLAASSKILRSYLNTASLVMQRHDGTAGEVHSQLGSAPGSTNLWYLQSFDGSSLNGMCSELEFDNFGVNRITTTASTRSLGALDHFRVGRQTNASTNYGSFEISDLIFLPTAITAADYSETGTGNDHYTEAMRNQQWYALERLGYSDNPRVKYGQSNAVNLEFWGNATSPIQNGAVNGTKWSGGLLPDGQYFEPFMDMVARHRQTNTVDIIFVHGEGDSNLEADANAYAANMQTWWDAAKASAARAGLTLRLFVEYLNASNTGTYSSTTRTQQETFVAANADAYAHNSDDLTLTDGVHYGSADLATRQGRFDAAIAAA